jgi:bacterioferritin
VREAIGLTDVKTLRARARQGVEDGAMTAGFEARAEKIITLLNEALATEIVCFLRYKRHYFMAKGIASLSVKGEFLQHATEEQAHADKLAERIAVDSYREMIAYVGTDDPTTRTVLEGILAHEEEHAEDLASLLEDLGS